MSTASYYIILWREFFVLMSDTSSFAGAVLVGVVTAFIVGVPAFIQWRKTLYEAAGKLEEERKEEKAELERQSEQLLNIIFKKTRYCLLAFRPVIYDSSGQATTQLNWDRSTMYNDMPMKMMKDGMYWVKYIEFSDGHLIGLGHNVNEHSWKIEDGKLNIYTENKKALYSQFRLDINSGRLVHTNNTECHSTLGQFMIPLYKIHESDFPENMTEANDYAEWGSIQSLFPSGDM